MKAAVSFPSKQSMPAGQQNFFSTQSVLGSKAGRLSLETLQESGRRVPNKLPHDVESSKPRLRFIDGQRMMLI